MIAASVLDHCRTRGWRIATAESCTGGLIAAALTAIPGSSDVFDRGFITYSNGAKSEMLGVDARLIESHGAVSAPVAAAMAVGALARSGADVAVSVTGVAGPGGGTTDKPVGTVWFGLAIRNSAAVTLHRLLPGDRDEIRAASVAQALQLLAGS